MKNLAAAFIVAVALGAAAMLWLPGREVERGQSQGSGAVNAPDPPPVDPAPYLAAFPLTPLEAPEVTGTGAAARALERAFVPYRKGDYAAAASALDGVRLDHPDDPTAALYLGISRLFIDEPQNALEILRTLPPDADPATIGHAAWYSLVGIARLRDPSHANEEARTLCRSGLPSASRACAALETLGRDRGSGVRGQGSGSR